jgi:hypothetical protein
MISFGYLHNPTNIVHYMSIIQRYFCAPRAPCALQNVYSNWLCGSGGLYPLRRRKFARLCSSFANCYCGQSSLSRRPSWRTHHTLSSYHSILDVESVTSHQVRHHDISKEPIPNDSDLARMRHACIRIFLEVIQHFLPAPWLLRVVS